jgi:hypothetical protein
VPDVGSYSGANFGINHYLGLAKVRDKLSVHKKETQNFNINRFNLKKLSDAAINPLKTKCICFT